MDARHYLVPGDSRVGPGRNDIGASRGHIMDGVEASLRRLQTDHIDLYQIHGNIP
jgi:aryl-alcohol dehydrogenase-like predicted oxidoreductase